jgi:hypothetical protein
VCEEHHRRLEGGEAWAFDERVLLLQDDMPTTVQSLTIHTDDEPEFTVTVEHGHNPEDVETLTVRLPLWSRRLLHASLSSRLENSE